MKALNVFVIVIITERIFTIWKMQNDDRGRERTFKAISEIEVSHFKGLYQEVDKVNIA